MITSTTLPGPGPKRISPSSISMTLDPALTRRALPGRRLCHCVLIDGGAASGGVFVFSSAAEGPCSSAHVCRGVDATTP